MPCDDNLSQGKRKIEKLQHYILKKITNTGIYNS